MSQGTIETFNGHSKTNGSAPKKALPIVGAPQAPALEGGDIDIERELARFEAEERARLGLGDPEKQWLETMANAQFTAKERPSITLLLAGLTVAHDYLVGGALTGLGY